MKRFAALLVLTWLLAGCTTTTSYKPEATAVVIPPKPMDYPIPVYTENMDVPRPCKLIGKVTIGHTSFTVIGGAVEDEMKKVMKLAHEKGADVIRVTQVQKPGYTTANYGVEANLLRYADVWETNVISNNDFAIYLQQHKNTLDPIEGVWSSGWPNRVGIIRDTSKPGRDFIAFTINSELPSWPYGYKKIDITRGIQPGTYQIKYYREDFSIAETTISLENNRAFAFALNAGDDTTMIRYKKLGDPIPVR